MKGSNTVFTNEVFSGRPDYLATSPTKRLGRYRSLRGLREVRITNRGALEIDFTIADGSGNALNGTLSLNENIHTDSELGRHLATLITLVENHVKEFEKIN